MSDEVTGQDVFDQAEAGGFEDLALVEPGKYRLELVANATNKDAVFVKGRVVGGPHEGKLVALGLMGFGEQGKNPDGARGIALKNVKGMGITKEDCKAIYAANQQHWSTFCKVIATWIDKRVVDAEIIYNDYNNEIRNQVDIGKITLVSAPPTPGFGAGVPTGVPTPQAAPPAAAAPAPTPEPAPAAAPAPVAAAPAPTPQPVAAAGASPASSDPGF